MRRSSCRDVVVVVLSAAYLLAFSAGASAATVAVIKIRSEITKGLAQYVDRALTDAERRADVVVFDMHTPGGRVDAMGEIVNRIFDATIPTIAYVRTEAISAGAVIALASDQIVMAPGATIGDAAPVDASGTELGEKAVAYIRGKIRATAERNGRNPDIAEAMVDKKKVLVKIGEDVRALTRAEYEDLQGADETMEVISQEGELLALTTKEALRLRFVETRASSLDDLLRSYSLVRDGDVTTVMTAAQIAEHRAQADGTPIRVEESLEDATVIALDRSLLESLSMAVTGSMLGSLLLSIGMLGLLVEIRTPGFGIPGALGLLALGLFFGGHMLASVQSSFGFIAFVLGVLLLILEVFVIPGFGIAGISGIVLIVSGLLFVFGQSASTFTAAMTSLGISILMTVALAVVVGMALPRTRAWNRLILSAVGRSDAGYRASRPELAALEGREGVALTVLRPAGTAAIGDDRVDVVADGEFIPKGTPITVVHVEGSRVVVRARKTDADA